MTIKYHHFAENQLLSERNFSCSKEKIQEAVINIKKIPAFSDLANIDICVSGERNPDFLLIGGMAINGYRAMITIDPRYPNWTEGTEIKSCAAHEIHHVVRLRKLGHAATFGGGFVLEGLAQVFEEENGFKRPKYSHNLTSQEFKAAAAKACAIAKNERDYTQYTSWLFGNGKKQTDEGHIKKWTGYSLGYGIVKSWLEENKKTGLGPKTAADAVFTEASEILEPWLSGQLDISQGYNVKKTFTP